MLLKVYYKAGEETKDKGVSESRDLIFGSLPKIAEFHRTLLLDALKSNTDNPKALGRAFIRLVTKAIPFNVLERLTKIFLKTGTRV